MGGNASSLFPDARSPLQLSQSNLSSLPLDFVDELANGRSLLYVQARLLLTRLGQVLSTNAELRETLIASADASGSQREAEDQLAEQLAELARTVDSAAGQDAADPSGLSASARLGARLLDQLHRLCGGPEPGALLRCLRTAFDISTEQQRKIWTACLRFADSDGAYSQLKQEVQGAQCFRPRETRLVLRALVLLDSFLLSMAPNSQRRSQSGRRSQRAGPDCRVCGPPPMLLPPRLAVQPLMQSVTLHCRSPCGGWDADETTTLSVKSGDSEPWPLPRPPLLPARRSAPTCQLAGSGGGARVAASIGARVVRRSCRNWLRLSRTAGERGRSTVAVSRLSTPSTPRRLRTQRNSPASLSLASRMFSQEVRRVRRPSELICLVRLIRSASSPTAQSPLARCQLRSISSWRLMRLLQRRLAVSPRRTSLGRTVETGGESGVLILSSFTAIDPSLTPHSQEDLLSPWRAAKLAAVAARVALRGKADAQTELQKMAQLPGLDAEPRVRRERSVANSQREVRRVRPEPGQHPGPGANAVTCPDQVRLAGVWPGAERAGNQSKTLSPVVNPIHTFAMPAMPLINLISCFLSALLRPWRYTACGGLSKLSLIQQKLYPADLECRLYWPRKMRKPLALDDFIPETPRTKSPAHRTVEIFDDSARRSDFSISASVFSAPLCTNQHCTSVQPCQTSKFHQHVNHICRRRRGEDGTLEGLAKDVQQLRFAHCRGLISETREIRNRVFMVTWCHLLKVQKLRHCRTWGSDPSLDETPERTHLNFAEAADQAGQQGEVAGLHTISLMSLKPPTSAAVWRGRRGFRPKDWREAEHRPPPSSCRGLPFRKINFFAVRARSRERQPGEELTAAASHFPFSWSCTFPAPGRGAGLGRALRCCRPAPAVLWPGRANRLRLPGGALVGGG
uniref:FH2 domain-containing protein n=1 Tax=Macrostomum lignano TaxID=282301 RepID=A0A1I8J743_9PLAT